MAEKIEKERDDREKAVCSKKIGLTAKWTISPAVSSLEKKKKKKIPS